MKVSPVILEKYYSGTANAEERKAVELWLEHPELDLPSSAVVPGEELRTDMWHEITTATSRRRHLRITGNLIGIAASFAAIFTLFSLFYTPQQHPLAEESYTGNITLKPASYNKGNYQMGKTGELSFCGDMEISNNGDEDFQVLFKTSCATSRPMQKSCTIQKGEAYIAVMFTHRKEEILVINKEDFRRETQPLPLRLTQKIANEFKI